jgi:glycosyltransferase involved in cell wall biosynthesis
MVRFKSKYDVCLLIPCYNNQAGLEKSLQSVKYKPGNLLVVIVDDGSDIPVTIDPLFRGGQEWPVQLIRLPENRGITVALNAGLAWIFEHLSCNYIARLDCGDYCHPDRFYEQVAYLQQRPDVDLVGSWCYFENPATGERYRYTTPVCHKAIKRAMHFRNVFIHPTVLLRAGLFQKVGYYPTDYPCAEDYALFWKIIKHTETHIIGKFLLICEYNEQGISLKNRGKQLESRMRIVNTFGANLIFKYINALKMKILMKIPYSAILFIKKKLS